MNRNIIFAPESSLFAQSLGKLREVKLATTYWMNNRRGNDEVEAIKPFGV